MKNSNKIISFEHKNEKPYYVVRSPNLKFGLNRTDAVVFNEHKDFIEAMNAFEFISFPWPKMIILDV